MTTVILLAANLLLQLFIILMLVTNIRKTMCINRTVNDTEDSVFTVRDMLASLQRQIKKFTR